MRAVEKVRVYQGVLLVAGLIGCQGGAPGPVAEEVVEVGGESSTGEGVDDVLPGGPADPDRGRAGADSASRTPRCRSYASSYITVYDGDDEDFSETSCRFDQSTYRLRCTLQGEFVLDSSVEKTYGSVDDFIDEGAAPGMSRWLTSVDKKPDGRVNYTETATYDRQGRLTFLDTVREDEVSPYWTEVYTRWDSTGRPFEGAMEFLGRYGQCLNWGVNWSYNPGERTATRIYSGGEGDGCYDETMVKTYDSDGNEVSSVTDDNSGWLTIEDRTITQWEEVCRGG